MKPVNKIDWVNINNFRDLQDAILMWFNGNAGFNPWSYAEVLTEDITSSETQKIKEINNLGLVTIDSQSGNCIDDVKERAYVSGFIRKDLLSKISRLLDEDVLILVYKYDIQEYEKFEPKKFLSNNKYYLEEGFITLTTEEYPYGLTENKEYIKIRNESEKYWNMINKLESNPVKARKNEEKVEKIKEYIKVLSKQNKQLIKKLKIYNNQRGIQPIKEIFTSLPYSDKYYIQNAIDNAINDYEDGPVGNIGPKLNRVIKEESYYIDLINLDMCKKDLLDKIINSLK